MTVNRAIEIIQKIIANTLEEYDQSPHSKKVDQAGNEVRIPHPLDIVDEQDILFALDISLKSIALTAAPVSLIEGNASSASELRRVSTEYYIRVPATPAEGENLDIDDGLSYAVVFAALGSLYREYGAYAQKADAIVETYVQAYRDYMHDLISGATGSAESASYIRFSADGEQWHDSYAQGDRYISFRRIDTQSWTGAIRFVGEDGRDGASCADTQLIALGDTPASYSGAGGKILKVKSDESGVEFAEAAGGGGVARFVALEDTPSTLVAQKWLRVNADGDALEFADAPSAPDSGANAFGEKPTYLDAGGSVELDTQNHNIFYLYPSTDAVYSFRRFEDEGEEVSGWWGSEYRFIIMAGDGINIAFDANESILGDATIRDGSVSSETTITATILRMIYTGSDWYVAGKEEILNANG